MPSSSTRSQALLVFGAPLEGITKDDFAHEGYFYQTGMAPVRIDILMSVTGLNFKSAWERRVAVDFDGVQTPFISREDLIVTKRAFGRPQDLIDVELLEKASGRNESREIAKE